MVWSWWRNSVASSCKFHNWRRSWIHSVLIPLSNEAPNCCCCCCLLGLGFPGVELFVAAVFLELALDCRPLELLLFLPPPPPPSSSSFLEEDDGGLFGSLSFCRPIIGTEVETGQITGIGTGIKVKTTTTRRIQYTHRRLSLFHAFTHSLTFLPSITLSGSLLILYVFGKQVNQIWAHEVWIMIEIAIKFQVRKRWK